MILPVRTQPRSFIRLKKESTMLYQAYRIEITTITGRFCG